MRAISRAELGKRVGVSEVSIGRYVKEPQRLDLTLLLQLAEALDCTVSQLIGETPLHGRERLDGITYHEQVRCLDQTYVALPLVPRGRDFTWDWDRLAALKGQPVVPTGGEGGARLVRLHGPARDPTELAVVEMPDDSMLPTLLPGEEFLLEAAKTISRDGIYALRFGDDMAVKRVQLHPITRRLRISSDNKSYAAYDDIAPDQLDVIGFVGRRALFLESRF